MITSTPSNLLSLSCILCTLSGIQLICLGIVGEYLAKVHLEVKNRPVYIIKEKPPVVPTPIVYYYSSNNYLKTLEAKGYEIKFDRDILEYELNVNNDVKSLDTNKVKRFFSPST